MVELTGFMMVNVQVPCIKGYNEEQIIIVLDDSSIRECPVILGSPTIYRVMQVIKESEITKLATPWAMSRFSWLTRGLVARVAQAPRNDVANRIIAPAHVDEVVWAHHKIQLPLFGHLYGHSRMHQSHFTWLSNECDDSWVASPPFGCRGTECLCYNHHRV